MGDATGIHMHSFVGFDPRRQVQEPGTPLALVKRAILEHGFVGVKLYPPMGFQASDNKGPIETALRRLYDWCKDADVPIMAHAENSIGAGCGDGRGQSRDRLAAYCRNCGLDSAWLSAFDTA